MSDVKDLAYKDYLAGMKYKDIAEKHNVSINTIKSWKTRYEWNREKGCTQNEKGAHTKREKVATKKKEIQAVAIEESQIIENSALTDKQQLFCLFYVKYRNKVKAYQKAYGCSYENACGHASELWKNVEVQKEVNRLLGEYRKNIDLDIKDLFQWYLDIARADMNDFVEVKNFRANVLSEIDGTLVSEIINTANGVNVKLNDRMKALAWLGEHIGLADEKQKAEIALLRAKAQTDEGEEIADDGFLEALDTSAGEDWLDEED